MELHTIDYQGGKILTTDKGHILYCFELHKYLQESSYGFPFTHKFDGDSAFKVAYQQWKPLLSPNKEDDTEDPDPAVTPYIDIIVDGAIDPNKKAGHRSRPNVNSGGKKYQKQVTYQNWPLYTYKRETNPPGGIIKGVWYVVDLNIPPIDLTHRVFLEESSEGHRRHMSILSGP